MAKRSAGNQLTHDNWDQEEESEDPGTFRTLNQEELKGRVIKKAKRKLVGNKEEGSGVSPFAAFSGFSSSSGSQKPFSFFPKSSTASTDSATEKKENGNSENNQVKENDHPHPTTTVSKNAESVKSKPLRSIEYYRHLQSLNESVMNWMQLHLSKNSCCDFTPVFNDYKKHLDTLNVTYPIKPVSTTETKDSPMSGLTGTLVSQKRRYEESGSENDSNSGAKRSVGNKKDDETDYGNNFTSNTTYTSTFSFGIMKTPSATSTLTSGPTSSSKEGAVPPDKKPFTFSFGLKSPEEGNKPFTFAAASVEKKDETENADDEVEYVPPKSECPPVEEKDAVYSKKCKLFYKKEEGFAEKGVGYLYLKPVDGKTQLLIRADTSLGNILLNIMLNESIPTSRTGKNNVLLVCVPNPPMNPKEDSKTAIPVLIRVKTSEDADELLETLNKHKS